MTNPPFDDIPNEALFLQTFAVLELLQHHEPDPERADMLRRLGSVRNHLMHRHMHGSGLGAEEVDAALADILEYLRGLEMTSLGTPEAQRMRQRAEPGVIVEALLRSTSPARRHHSMTRQEDENPVAEFCVAMLNEPELAVAELILKGLTYRQIAKQLFISTKTVEHHVARMRQRLNVSSRDDLFAQLRTFVSEDRPVSREFRGYEGQPNTVLQTRKARLVIHPPPTRRTVKELYGNACRCAFPNCAEPLYKESGQAHRRMLNSEVAHIFSRREGGPRWRPTTDDENASFSNLLLLCPAHHTEVDRLELVGQYTEQKLRIWKDQQVRESAGQGVELSDDEADEIVRSFTDASTVVSAMHLTVGGTGGSAPGASCGGGGAIGAGAVGGPGGSVGRIDLDGTMGQGPGTGGGGGGVLANDAIAWSSQELQTGSEGKGGVYGMDGWPGGTSSFGQHVVAPGGAAGLSGSDVRSVSDALKVSSLLVGEYIYVRDSLVFTVAGAWQWISVLKLPHRQPLPVLIICEAGGVAPGDYTVRLEIRGPSGQLGGGAIFPLTVEEQGDVLRIPVPVPVSVEWTSYGKWTIIASSDVAELARYDLIVKRVVS